MLVLIEASAKKVIKRNMSSILVIAKELQAVPTDLPKSMTRELEQLKAAMIPTTTWTEAKVD
jgi:hypothetical protein